MTEPRRYVHCIRAAVICSECEAYLTPVAGAEPAEGDFAECPRCQTVSVYRADLTLRGASDKERERFTQRMRALVQGAPPDFPSTTT